MSAPNVHAAWPWLSPSKTEDEAAASHPAKFATGREYVARENPRGSNAADLHDGDTAENQPPEWRGRPLKANESGHVVTSLQIFEGR